MRYTLFVCSSLSSAQLRTSEDLEALKDDANHQKIAYCEDYA